MFSTVTGNWKTANNALKIPREMIFNLELYNELIKYKSTIKIEAF